MMRIMRSLPLAAAFLITGELRAQGAPPPDVYLAPLDLRGGAVKVGTPLNITARAGYDNQPSFAPDGRSVFFTSVRSDAQADIYRYDIGRKATSRVTATAPESEYSAFVIPGTTDLAVIRVERDSTQRLWRFPLRLAGGRGALGSVLLERVKPAGYFAFADAGTVALFVLGAPASLQLATVSTGTADTIAVNVGRSLHRVPGKHAISYVSKAYEQAWWVMSLDIDSRHVLPVAKLPEGVEDYAWLPDGRLLAGQGSKLLVCDPSRDAAWVEVADLSATVGSITRLAVSPTASHVAIVGVPSGAR